VGSFLGEDSFIGSVLLWDLGSGSCGANILTPYFTCVSMCYVLIGHELAQPHCCLVVNAFSPSCRLKAVYLLFSCHVFLKPGNLLFSVGMLGYLHRLPLYYKSLVYYCLGSVVKSLVLYLSYSSQS
jgi:hypothetical protein